MKKYEIRKQHLVKMKPKQARAHVIRKTIHEKFLEDLFMNVQNKSKIQYPINCYIGKYTNQLKRHLTITMFKARTRMLDI